MSSADVTSPSTGLWRPLGIALTLILATVGIDLLTLPPGAKLTREHGGLELASALLYLWAAAVWMARQGWQGLARDWQVPAVLLMMSGREFDIDKSLTSVGLLKSDLYLTAEAPVWERLLGVVVLTFAVVTLVRLARRQGRGFLAGVRRGAPAQLAVLTGLLVAVLAKTVDGLGRKLQSFGIALDPAMGAWIGSAEEVIELFVPLLFLAAIVQAARGPR